jgi:hypothetical protein
MPTASLPRPTPQKLLAPSQCFQHNKPEESFRGFIKMPGRSTDPASKRCDGRQDLMVDRAPMKGYRPTMKAVRAHMKGNRAARQDTRRCTPTPRG